MKINSRHYILIVFALISIITTSIVYIFLYSKIVIQAQNYVDKNEEIKNEDSKKQTEQKLLKMYNSTDESRTKISTFFIDEEKIVDFINMIEKIGIDSKVDIKLSSINNLDNKIKVKITAKGLWVNIITALALLENLPLSTLINNIKLDSTSNLDKAGKSIYYWNLDLDMEVLISKNLKK